MDYSEAMVVPIAGARATDQLDEDAGAADMDISTGQWERIMSACYDEDDRRWDR